MNKIDIHTNLKGVLKALLFVFLSIWIFFATTKITIAQEDIPKPLGFVNDFEGILSIDESLELKLEANREDTTNEIVIVTTDNYGSYNDQNLYATELFEQWKIGNEKNDNGLLILVSKEKREIWIEVGYGLEGALNDSKVGKLIDDYAIEELKNDNYDQAIDSLTNALINESYNEYSAEDEPLISQSTFQNIGDWFVAGFFIIIFIGIFIWEILLSIARSKSVWLGGIIGSIIAILISFGWSSLLIGLGVGIILDALLSWLGTHDPFKSYLAKQANQLNSHKNSDKIFPKTPWGSSWGGGSGGSSGGFGGFGGGMSGGGGAGRGF